MNSELLKEIQVAWGKLQSREKILVTTMIGVVTLFLFYVLIWLPISKDINKLRVSVPKSEASLAVMRVQAVKIKSLKSRHPTSGGSGGLLSKLEQAANQKGLRQFITKMEPDGNTGVRLTIEGASLNNLLSLLSGLHKNAGLRVDNATLSPVGEAPGIVNARLVLKGSDA